MRAYDIYVHDVATQMDWLDKPRVFLETREANHAVHIVLALKEQLKADGYSETWTCPEEGYLEVEGETPTGVVRSYRIYIAEEAS